MGNCQAIDNATILIQHPSGRIDKLYSPVNANQIMKTNPGHYVALLLTTTYYPPPERSNSRIQAGIVHESSHIDHPSTNTITTTITTNPLNDKSNVPVRITRIKLLRPTDTLALGHVYRLITTHEVMKGLRAKKYSKLTKEQKEKIITDKFTASDFEYVDRKSVEKKSIQVNKEMNHRVPVVPPPATSSATTPKSRGGGGWQPRLQSILESTS